jgi:hypothetical protein
MQSKPRSTRTVIEQHRRKLKRISVDPRRIAAEVRDLEYEFFGTGNAEEKARA